MTIFSHNIKSYTDVILSSHLSKRLEEKIKEELRIEIRTLCVLQKAKQNYRQIDFDRAV